MSANSAESTEKALLEGNEEYKQLHDDHVHFEALLEQLAQKKFLTSEEDVEFKRIKKLKLQGKDRMNQILEEAKAQG